MALVSDLVGVIAEVEGLPEGTVALNARVLREAGLLSTGARGRNAPKATVRDAANLLIGVNACGCIVKDAPAAVESYRRLRTDGGHGETTITGTGRELQPIEFEALRFLDTHDATFGEMLEGIVERFVSDDLGAFMRLQAWSYIGAKAQADFLSSKGSDPAGALERLNRAVAEVLRVGSVGFNVTFNRPHPFAVIKIGRVKASQVEIFAYADFGVTVEDREAGRVVETNGDRRDETVIGFRTLSRVAELLR